MNYIKEINAFIDWLETNPLEASTQTLWFHLMGIANKSGWPEWFTVANLTLQAKVGVTENTLSKHRNILVQRGRIEYRSQGKQKAGKYRILSLTAEFTSNIEAKHEVKHAVNTEVNLAVNHEANYSALYKLNETELNVIDQDARDRLRILINQLGMKGVGFVGLDTVYWYIGRADIEVIEKALNKAKGKHLNYFVEIINGWIEEGKTTIEAFGPLKNGGDYSAEQGNSSGQAGSTDAGSNSLSSRFTKTE